MVPGCFNKLTLVTSLKDAELTLYATDCVQATGYSLLLKHYTGCQKDVSCGLTVSRSQCCIVLSK